MSGGGELGLEELERSWDVPRFPAPPPAETEARLDRRWAETTQLREKISAEVDRRAGEWHELLADLVRIPSVNPSEAGERAMADRVAEHMTALGMSVRQHEPVPNRVSNLATLTGTHSREPMLPNLLYYGHLDTVPPGTAENWTYPPFSATIADGRMWGRGTKDCKLGIVSALAATRVLQDLGIELAGDFLMVTPADEEAGGHRGIASMIDAGWLEGVAACIYGEGQPNRVTVGAHGNFQFKVVVKGKSSHTARKHLGTNAILRALDVARAIDTIAFDDFVPHDVVPGMPTASVNLISGGYKINVVPDRCELHVDLRYPPNYTPAMAEATVRASLDGLRKRPELHDLDYDLETMSLARPYYIPPGHPLALAMARCARETTGSDPVIEGNVASSDARWICLDAEIPVVSFAHGNQSGHQPNEYVDLDAIVANVKSYALLTLLMLG